MTDLLRTICEETRQGVARRRRELSARDLESLPWFERGRVPFAARLRADAREGGCPAVISEFKRASPSKGSFAPDARPEEFIPRMVEGGASAISVLTDGPFFKGSLDDLSAASELGTRVPLLRKDFILDPYQVVEARAHGADALLLIRAALADTQLVELLAASLEAGLDVLIECETTQDWIDIGDEVLRVAPDGGHVAIGVNNRNLRTFDTRPEAGLAQLSGIPSDLVRVSESGLSTPEDLARLSAHGIEAALIGEAVMRSGNPAEWIAGLKERARDLRAAQGGAS